MIRTGRRFAAPILLLAMLAAVPAAAQRAPAPQGVTDFNDVNMNQTRDSMMQLLSEYPPSLSAVLRTDHSLLSNEEFLAPYPRLKAFLSQHPEILRNPQFFVGDSRFGPFPNRPNTPSYDIERVMEPVLFFLGFLSVIGAVSFVARSLIDYRRWARAFKVQNEVHTKILDRFGKSEELLAYIETPAGKRFLESTPISVESRAGAPVSRILWSVQIGLVLAVGGVGLEYVSNTFQDVAAQPFFVMGVLAIALGVGFIVSALASYVISQRLGLLDQHPETPPS